MFNAPSVVAFATYTRDGWNQWADGFDAAAWFMLALLGVVLAMGGLFVWMIRRQLRKEGLPSVAAIEAAGRDRNAVMEGVDEPSLPGASSGFEKVAPSEWIAVKGNDLEEIRGALGLAQAKPFAWSGGMEDLDEASLVLTPPIYGWVLIMGPGLQWATDDVDECFRLITHMSRELGLVQYFDATPSVAYHSWVQALNGRIIRAYSWQGETLWNQGERTLAEKKLMMACDDYGQGSDDGDAFFSESYARACRNLDKIYKLAAMWSVDPTSLDPSVLNRGQGMIGRIPLQ